MNPLAILVSAVVTCAGVDDTAAIQAAVDAGHTTIVGSCAVNGTLGIRLPGERTIDASAAVLTMLPGCVSKCKIAETVPGARGVRWLGGELIGWLTPAIGWQIGLRVDSGHDVQVIGATFRNFRTDGLHVGGNAQSTNVLISGIVVDVAGRNGLSIVNAVGVTVERSVFRGANFVSPGPGAGIDVEPNPGESVDDFTLINSELSGNLVGAYLHMGRGSVQGKNYKVISCRFLGNKTHGIILNSILGATIADNTIDTPGAVGVSVGSHTESARAAHVKIIGNRITALRPLILAGVRNSHVLDNSLGAGGRVESPVLGFSGDMSFEQDGQAH